MAQVQFYLQNLYGDKEATVYKKLQKWHNLNIIKSEAYSDGKNPYKCVRIDKNGMEILTNEGVVPHKNDRYKYITTPGHSSGDHYFGTREVIIRFMLEVEVKGMQPFVSISPSELPYNDLEEEKALEQHVTPGAKLTPIVIPDWILYTRDAILNIESDTGTEYTERVIEKVKKYVHYVQQGLESKVHHVLIVPPDSADDDILCYVKTPPKERNKRVGSLKDSIMRASAHVVPNLHFYVVSSSRSGKVSYNILSGNYQNHAAVANEVVLAFQTDPNLCVKAEEVLASDIYPQNINDSVYADAHLLVKGPDGTSKLLLVKVMDEGSVKSLSELEYLNYLVVNDRLHKQVDEVLAIYMTDEELQTDTLGERWNLKKVLFTSLKQLNKSGKSRATFYRSTKPLKKSRCSLYEG